jgi:hypothetical protein
MILVAMIAHSEIPVGATLAVPLTDAVTVNTIFHMDHRLAPFTIAVVFIKAAIAQSRCRLRDVSLPHPRAIAAVATDAERDIIIVPLEAGISRSPRL